jgi:hypothetical protein
MKSGSVSIGDKIIEFNVAITGNLDPRTDIQVTFTNRTSMEAVCQLFVLPRDQVDQSNLQLLQGALADALKREAKDALGGIDLDLPSIARVNQCYEMLAAKGS